MTPEEFGCYTDRGDLLPKRVEAYREHLAARARLWDEGLDTSGALPVDKAESFFSGGHGTTARRYKHIRDGEAPCVECAAAEHAYRHPAGAEWPFGWKLERQQ